MGAIGWAAVTALLLAAGLAGAWYLAHARGAVGLLDSADRIIGGTQGTVLVRSGAAYGSHPAQQLDVIAPAAPGPHPVVVFFHGGGWDSGRPADYRFVGRTFAREGYVVVLAGYRLVPEGAYPAMLEDAGSALGWVGAHAAQVGGDPERIFLMGHSAGAHIAAMMALEPRWLAGQGLARDFVKGVVGLSGPYDFHPFTSDSARRAFGHVADPAVTQPIGFARADAPPMLLVTGDADTTVRPRNSHALAKALSAAGAGAEVVVLPGLDHAGTVKVLAWPFAGDDRVRQAALSFLGKTGRASAPVQASAP